MLKATYFNSTLLGIDICIYTYTYMCISTHTEAYNVYVYVCIDALCIVQQITRAYYLRPIE